MTWKRSQRWIGAAAAAALSGLGIASAATPPAELRLEALEYTSSLRTLRRPEPPNLAQFVVDRGALLRLGKALFWDQQLGSDGQACATCHYHGGADARSKNQLNPGFRNETIPGGDLAFGNSPLAPASAPAFGPNHQLTLADFPFHKLADPRNAASALLSDTNDVASSQGVFAATFTGLDAAGDLGSPGPAGVFAVGDARVRSVEPRNTPTTINAVFNKRNFWDGRARSEFNGVNPIGLLDPGARVVNVAGAAQLVAVSLPDASLASQASGPQLSDLEMSFGGRRFADLGRKLLSPGVGVLAGQLVAPDDSVLGAFSNQRAGPGVRGTSLRYADLVREAFAPEWWNGGDARVDLSGGAPVVVPGGGTGPSLFTAMEYNFSLFSSLAIADYERTLVSDDTRFDRFLEGDLAALELREQAGLEVFIGPGKCVSCHKGPALTSAAIPVRPFGPLEIIERMIVGDRGAATGQPDTRGVLPDLSVGAYDNGFYNIGVRPTREDLGLGASIGPLSLPLSETGRAQACVRREVDALVLAGAATDAAIRQANATCKVPRPVARGAEAALVLRVAAQRLANPADVMVLIEGASALLAAPPVGSNFVKAHADLEHARRLLAASPALTPAVATMLDGARRLLPDPVDPGADLLLPWGPPLEPDERIVVEGTFKAPGLRNVELTAPYFHNGGQATLHQVVEFYNRGGDFAVANREHLDADIVPLQLFPQQEDDLVAFLKALTDERVRHDRAPFDHPSLSLPDGGTPGLATTLVGMAVLDDHVELPAVGAAGAEVPLGSAGTPFANFPDALYAEVAAPPVEGPGPGAGASLPPPVAELPPVADPAAPAAPAAPPTVGAVAVAGTGARGGCSTAPGGGAGALLLAASTLLLGRRRRRVPDPAPHGGPAFMHDQSSPTPHARHLVPLALVCSLCAPSLALAAAINVPVVGEIQRITVDDPSDHWSGGTMVVGAQTVILPRNLLLDLPANRLTLQQLVTEAPAVCAALGETGLAKEDACNSSGVGGIASLSANRTAAGNVIAGDVLVSKGIDALAGRITYVDHDDGYFRMNGVPGDATTGVMVRLNDPEGRHTVQQGLGCAGGPNCSADPRFTLDGHNYTNVFSTGYPLCIPSTTQRTFADVLGLGTTTAQAMADGTGDVLCPQANRPPIGVPVADSRRFAPIQLGDSITVEGNFERVDGVRFLSAHSSMISRALTTLDAPDQPDYLFLDEVGIDAAGFQNQRARSLIIGHATRGPADVLVWSLHYDTNNTPHEFPLASTLGCDAAAGVGACTNQGLVGTGANIFKVVHDVDFLFGVTPGHSPCAHLRADPRFSGLDLCPSAGINGTSSLAEEFAILSPISREIQARTGHSLAHPGLLTIDVNGLPATNGQYLFPFGANLGGVGFPEFNEIDLDRLDTPFSFSGLPWALDRRLSPGGCRDLDGDGVPDCEASPQPLDPFPFEGFDPRTQASIPSIGYADRNYTASPLSSTADRILSYVDPQRGNFDGDRTILAWPPVDPPYRVIEPSTVVPAPNHPPVAASDVAATTAGSPVTIPVLANDGDPDGHAIGVAAVSQARSGIVTHGGASLTYTPEAGFVGIDVFTYTIIDGHGGSAVGAVAVNVVAPGQPETLPPPPTSAAAPLVDVTPPVTPPAAPAAPVAAPAGTAGPAGGGCSSTGSGASLPFLLAMATLLATRRRRSV